MNRGNVPAGILLAAFVAVGAAVAAEHPTLVSAEGADCTACHDDLMEGKATLHAIAADDCTACHDVATSDEGTRISLMDQEPALCVMCHDDLTAAVEADLATPHFPVTDSCLTCHDPHASEQTSLLLSAPSELCGACHDSADLKEPHGGQLTESTDCSQCHQPHGSQNDKMLQGSHQHRPFADGSCAGCHRPPSTTRVRLRARGERLCAACHGDILDPPENGMAHAAMTGDRRRAGCLACHDPHMSDRGKLLTRGGSDLCADCHGEVVAAARGDLGHAPAADDCVSCHAPHTSSESRLLTAPKGELCATCHDIEDEELAATHLGAELGALDCVSCHTPHGGEHEKLLAENLHAPVLDGCDTCHEGGHDELMEGGDSPLCLICHDDIGEVAETAEFPHGAMELARCVDCHNPHASPQPKLVKSPGGAVCLECHEDQGPGDDEAAHGVIEEVGCQACHEPHGGASERLLRTEGAELCLGCHDEALAKRLGDDPSLRVLDRFEFSREEVLSMASLRLSPDKQQGHPVQYHRVGGTPTEEELKKTESTFTAELTCLTCHDPHKGRSELLLRWNAESPDDACSHCHQK